MTDHTTKEFLLLAIDGLQHRLDQFQSQLAAIRAAALGEDAPDEPKRGRGRPPKTGNRHMPPKADNRLMPPKAGNRHMPPWSPERKARFMATVAARRAAKASPPENAPVVRLAKRGQPKGDRLTPEGRRRLSEATKRHWREKKRAAKAAAAD